MNKQLLASILLLFVVSTINCQVSVSEEEDVLVITDENFDEVSKTYEFLLLEFYAPWCGHCKTLAPEYASAAQQLKQDPAYAHVRLGKVDATVHKNLAGKYEIKGFPTVFLLNNGVKTDYKGARKADAIVQFLKQKSIPPKVAQVNSVEEVEKLRASNKVVVVFFGDVSSPEHATFDEVFKKLHEEAQFAQTSDAAVSAHYSPKGHVVLFKQFDELRNDLEGTLTFDDLVRFVVANKSELVGEFDQEIAGAVFSDGKPALFLFQNENAVDEQAKNNFRDAAKQLRGEVIFSWCVVNQGFGKKLADFIGVNEQQSPRVVLVHSKNNEHMKYHLTDLSVSAIVSHYKSFLQGTLTPTVKSEEIPADNSAPVKIVVGKNFEDLVLKNDKNVLVEFYAPWCGHCKKLAPIWDELGEKYKDHPNVVIAKCDYPANEISGLGIQGFPTIKFFPANNKQLPGQEYKGGRELADFVKFLDENAGPSQKQTDL